MSSTEEAEHAARLWQFVHRDALEVVSCTDTGVLSIDAKAGLERLEK